MHRQLFDQPEILSAIARPTLLPRQVKECRRLLRPGGVLAIADNNPRSKVIQNLPPVLFTLMKRWGAACMMLPVRSACRRGAPSTPGSQRKRPSGSPGCGALHQLCPNALS